MIHRAGTSDSNVCSIPVWKFMAVDDANGVAALPAKVEAAGTGERVCSSSAVFPAEHASASGPCRTRIILFKPIIVVTSNATQSVQPINPSSARHKMNEL